MNLPCWLALLVAQQPAQQPILSQPIARVDVKPAAYALKVGDTLRLAATAYDSAGKPVDGVVFAWFTSGGRFEGTVDSTGLVSAGATGTLNVAAVGRIPGRQIRPTIGMARVTVLPLPAAKVVVAPRPRRMLAGTSLVLDADLYAANALWRLPELQTVVLRICYTLGPSGHGTLAGYLRARFVPMVMGFDPLFHFMHEDDAADAIVKALSARARGVFNVAGPQPLPLSVIAHEAGRRVLPLPETVLARLVGRAGLPRLSHGALAHIKYPIVVDASLFRRETGFAHRFDELTTARTFADAFPPGGRTNPVPAPG